MRHIWTLLMICLFIPMSVIIAQNDALLLEQEFSNDFIIFQYPEGWVVEDLDEVVRLATEEEALESGDDLGIGQARITLIIGDLDEFEVPQQATLADAREAIEVFNAETMPSTCGLLWTIPDLAENGRHTAELFYECSGTDNLILLRQVDNENYAAMFISIEKNNLNSMYETLLAVMHTIDLPENRTTHTILTKNLVLKLPDGWYISEMIVEGNTLLVIAPVEHFVWERWTADVPFAIVNRFSLEELGIADADNPPVAAIEVYDEESAGNSFGEITPFKYDNRPAAMTDAISPHVDIRFVLLMMDENNFITLTIYAPWGSIDEVMEEILSIIETATLLSDSGVNIEINIELPQMRLSDDGEYAFDYPENWIIEGNEHRQTLVGNIEVAEDTEVVFKFDRDTSIEDVCTYFDDLPDLYTELHYIFNIGCFTVNGREVVRLIVTDEYRIFNLYEYAIEIEAGVFLHFSIYQPPYENPEFEETIFAMLTSVRQNP